jgi:predicted alpha/beta hydrolase family esterase
VLLLPGLGGSPPGHRQSLWEARFPKFRRVEQSRWDALRLGAWTIRLEMAVRASPSGPVVLVAHSLACALVAHWARLGSVRRVAAALLVAPADVECPGAPEAVRSFAPLPLERLPFPSWLVASSDDPHSELERARAFGRAWSGSAAGDGVASGVPPQALASPTRPTAHGSDRRTSSTLPLKAKGPW